MRARRVLAWTAAAFAASAIVFGAVLTTPAGAHLLQTQMEWWTRADPSEQYGKAQAIVVLGGRTNRVRFGAELHRMVPLPILVTGRGTGDSPYKAESEKMAHILRSEYGIAPRWLETQSLDTAENAELSRCLLEAAGVRSIVLVTDSRHMLRGSTAFEAAGFEVVRFTIPPPWRESPPVALSTFLPSQAATDEAMALVREAAGAWVIWRRVRASAQASCATPH
jgi:uncharacterized SAM-binding protein YcdF (DUF218 family)